jgi:hypothetical protein
MRTRLTAATILATVLLLASGETLWGGGLTSWDAVRAVVMKRTAGKTYRDVFLVSGSQLDLFSCGGHLDVVDGEDPYADVVDLAVWLDLLSRDIRARGVYEAGRPYLDLLESYGQTQVARLDSGRLHAPELWSDVNKPTLLRLARTLNSALGREIYIVEGGCGAGEIPVSLRIPRGTSAMIINTFRYDLCLVRNVDPQDMVVCSGWRPVTGIPMYLAGGYRYILSRAGGSRSSGEFVVDFRRIGGSFGDDRPFPIDLR